MGMACATVVLPIQNRRAGATLLAMSKITQDILTWFDAAISGRVSFAVPKTAEYGRFSTGVMSKAVTERGKKGLPQKSHSATDPVCG